MKTNIINDIRLDLQQNSSEAARQTGLRFFKESVKMYGMYSAVVKRISNENYLKVKDLSKKEIFEFCDEFWKSGMMEESFIACVWSNNQRKNFLPEDFKLFDHWVNSYIGNWASCDTFCNHTMGEFVVMYPEFIEELKKWAKSDNRWVKRAAAVSLIVPARKGKFLKDIFEIADIMLLDKDDMVQKGYGWMLKSASQFYQKEVFDYVVKNKVVMPRTALRYAIEKMPKELKVVAMKK
jgi:3-methyladenine DNA glycosylase AlkD